MYENRTYPDKKCRECNNNYNPRSSNSVWCGDCKEEYGSKDLNRLWKIYGLKMHELIAMYNQQDRGCAICQSYIQFIKRGSGTKGNKAKLNIDHCHTTGKIRGLLCWDCNTAIGKLGDTANRVMRAVNYLRKAEDETSI